jgi:diaminopimelate epimerase
VLAGLPFTKGHGTENDFVLVRDLEGTLELPAEQIAKVCDRHAGVGADGLIRAVRCDRIPEGSGMAATWFMDYRNGDGSVAQMCGNGVRVFAAYLLDQGLVQAPELAAGMAIGTRAGLRYVQAVGVGDYTVGMGGWQLPGGEAAAAAGRDVAVVAGGGEALPGLSVDVGNPHVVVVLPTVEHLQKLDLTHAPLIEPPPPEGANVEFIVVADSGSVDPPDAGSAAVARAGVGALTMRVHERGVGETRSCGTGVCASVVAARVWSADASLRQWVVDVPGGRVWVNVADSGELELTGPAVLVADGRLRP